MPWCRLSSTLIFFFFNDTATTEIYTLSLYDALPISDRVAVLAVPLGPQGREVADLVAAVADVPGLGDELDLADDRVLVHQVEEGRQPVDGVQLAGQRRGDRKSVV